MEHRELFTLLAVLCMSPVANAKYRNLTQDEESGLPLIQWNFLPSFCTDIATRPVNFSRDGISQAYASTAK